MKRCALLSCNLPSTDQLYQQDAKRRGNKFDRLMTRGKLLDNNAQLFIFISILMMTKGTQKTDNRTDSRNGDSRGKKTQLQGSKLTFLKTRKLLRVVLIWTRKLLCPARS